MKFVLMTLSMANLLKALTATNDINVKLALKFAIMHGLTIPEVLGLRGSDFDFDKNIVKVSDREVKLNPDVFTQQELTLLKRRKNETIKEHTYFTLCIQIRRACEKAGISPKFTPKVMKCMFQNNSSMFPYSDMVVTVASRDRMREIESDDGEK